MNLGVLFMSEIQPKPHTEKRKVFKNKEVHAIKDDSLRQLQTEFKENDSGRDERKKDRQDQPDTTDNQEKTDFQCNLKQDDAFPNYFSWMFRDGSVESDLGVSMLHHNQLQPDPVLNYIALSRTCTCDHHRRQQREYEQMGRDGSSRRTPQTTSETPKASSSSSSSPPELSEEPTDHQQNSDTSDGQSTSNPKISSPAVITDGCDLYESLPEHNFQLRNGIYHDPAGNWTLKAADPIGQNIFQPLSLKQLTKVSALPNATSLTANPSGARLTRHWHRRSDVSRTFSPISEMPRRNATWTNMTTAADRMEPSEGLDQQLPECLHNIILERMNDSKSHAAQKSHKEQKQLKKLAHSFIIPLDPSDPTAFTENWPEFRKPASKRSSCGSKPVQKVVVVFISLVTLGIIIFLIYVYNNSNLLRPMM